MTPLDQISSAMRTLVVAAVAGSSVSLVLAIERLAASKPMVATIYHGHVLPAAFELIATWHVVLSATSALLAAVILAAIFRSKNTHRAIGVGAWFAVVAFVLSPIVTQIAFAPMADILRILPS